jgi:GST-like protein
MCGNFGHFMVYAPADECAARGYRVARYGMESWRLLSVLDQQLAGKT